MQCKYCQHSCFKAGRQPNGKQKYFCNLCKKYQQSEYVYDACKENQEAKIILLNNEGCGIRSIARILSISATTVIKNIKAIADKIISPALQPHSDYETDELKTFVQNKETECWVAYAICKLTGKVEAFTIGRRTKENIEQVINTLLLNEAHSIATDGLNIYPQLIPSTIHRQGRNRTNKIERMNLTLRTHLKRLNRKTICFSKTYAMLNACLKIYCWQQEVNQL